MSDPTVIQRLEALSTPHLADAYVRLGLTLRCAPSNVRGVASKMRCEGHCKPAKHAGSVDVFLEAIASASPGDVLVVDNDGRLDEACLGDLIALEAKMAGLAGIVIWGLHRDTGELLDIGLPIFSLGTIPNGPLTARPRCQDALASAMVGTCDVSIEDMAVADSDGVIFLRQSDIQQVLQIAEGIRDTEKRQARLMLEGRSLRDQTSFEDYIQKSGLDPKYSFREHLRSVAGAIET